MAVFTAAAVSIMAVSAAVGTAATVAAVATAVVTTSIAIGVAGLAVTAVGLVTENKDLLKAGKIMGYVGMAGGLAGGAIGGFGAMANSTGTFLEGASNAYASASVEIGKAWDSGVGSLFAGGDKVAGALPGGAEAGTSTGQQPFVGTELNKGIGATTPSTSLDPNASLPGVSGNYQLKADPMLAASSAPSPTVPVPANVQPPAPPSSLDNIINSSQGAIDKTIASGPLGAPSTPSNFFADAANKAADGLANMPDWAKYAGFTTVGQGASGLASGYFAGLSAEEKLKQEQLQNQQQQNQLALLNTQGSYAPLIQFKRSA